MATLGDWDKHFESLPKERLEELKKALETLQRDEMLQREFNWTCVFVLIHSIRYAIEKK